MAALQQLAAAAADLSKEGKFKEAAAKYGEILAQNDEIAEVHLNQGVALSNAGDLDGALAAFQRAAELKPSLPGAHANAGNILKRQNRNKEAVACFRDAVDQDASLVSCWSNMAHCLNALDKFEDALEACSEGIAAATSLHIPLHNERIFALFKLSRADDAVADVEAILSEKPLEKLDQGQRELFCMIFSQKGSRLLSKGDAKRALTFLERASEGDPSGANLFPYGVCLLHLGKDDEAISVLEKAETLLPGNWRVPVALGTALMRRKDFEGALAAFKRALAHPEPQKDSTVMFNYAVCLMNVGRDAEAKDPLEFVVTAEPDNHVALGLLGTLYLEAKEYASAVETLERAAELPGAKSDSSLMYNLGYARLMVDKPDEALESFEEAARIDPKNEQAASAVRALSPAKEMEKRASKRGVADEKRASKRDIDAEIRETVRIAQARGANPMRTEEEMIRDAKKAQNALERAKAMLSAQRPPFARRPSMEGIRLGFVTKMAEVYDELTLENRQQSW